VLDCAENPRALFDVSPDGQYLVLSLRADPQRPWGIARVRMSDGRTERVTQPAPGGPDDVRPRYSPDGSRFVFSRGNASHGKLWMASAQPPFESRALDTPEGLDYGVAWLGTNGPLLVAADWPGFRALLRVDLASGAVDLAGGRGARFPDVNRHGDIVFEEARYRADLWLTSTATPGTPARALWPSTRYTNQPSFSPDGKRLVFVSNREGAEALYVGSLDGPARRITGGAEHRHIRPHWSPSGDALYASRSPVSARQSGPHEAVRIDVATGRVQVLGLGDNVAEVLPLGSDADLLVAETDGHAVRLARVRDGRRERLPLPAVSEFQVRGDDLVYLLHDQPGLTRCSLASLACSPLPVQVAPADRYHWHLGDGMLWLRNSGGDALRLQRFDLSNPSRPPAEFAFAPTGTGTSIATSPDGKSLVISREAPVAIDLMLARTIRGAR